jgi:hypothetical protein
MRPVCTALRAAATACTLSLVTATASAAPCPLQAPSEFEKQGYSVRNARVAGFRWLGRALESSSGPLAPLEGKPFTVSAALKSRNDLRQTIVQLPMPFESPVSVTVVGPPRLVNCESAPSGNHLDVEYPVYTAKLPFTSVRTPESAELERSDPRRALALSPEKSPVSLTPALGYNASQNLWAGGRMRLRWLAGLLDVNGQGSTEGGDLSTTFSASREAERGWLRKIEWRGGFALTDHPSDQTSLESERGLGQISFVTAPLGSVGALLRFGTLFEGGHEEASPSAVPPAGTVPASRFANWRTYGGLSLRRGQHSFAASYGLLLGRTGSGRLFDYRKQIVDLVHEARVPSTLRALEIGSRFTAGALAQLGPTPVPERFFGGNVETSFIPGSEWVIRSNPVLRGVPAYTLNRPSADAPPAGSDRFVVFNFTIAVPVFVKPLLPEGAADDKEVRTEVDKLLEGGVSILQALNEVDDPEHRVLFDTRRGELEKTTAAMEARVAALESSIPAKLQSAYDACAEKIGDLAADASDIRASTPWINFLDADPEDRGIPVVTQLCLVNLNGALMDAEVSRIGDELREHEKAIAAQLAKIDTASARREAEREMEFPRIVIRKSFDEMTFVSISPVFVFDVGRLSDLEGRSSVRYSVGGGLRLTIASIVSFELGYAQNLKRQPGDGPGALFFATRFIDVFGK